MIYGINVVSVPYIVPMGLKYISGSLYVIITGAEIKIVRDN